MSQSPGAAGATPRFEEIPHTADWSFRVFGREPRELFANAAHALFALEGATPRQNAAEIARTVEVSGLDYEALLVNWLSELLYLQEAYHETYHHFDIEFLSPTALRARVLGTRLGALDKIIKAVTYHNLEIKPTSEGWQATVVVDV